MNNIWVTNLDTAECFYELIEDLEKDIGYTLNKHQREIVFLEMMKQKGIKPAGQNELTKAELIKELVNNGKKILNVDENGFTFIKKKEN